MKNLVFNLFVYGLALLFIALKLTHVINWSWFCVLSPIIISLSIMALCWMIIGAAYMYVNRSKFGDKK